jgi:hypothetical protein
VAGYLENYGVSDARRERIIRRTVLALLIVTVASTSLYFLLRDWPQRRVVNQFLSELQKKDYKAAYALWGCTDQTPCRYYAFDKFLEDWGPNSPFANAAQAKRTGSEHCGTGVFVWVAAPGKPPAVLWVEKSNNVIGFAPWEECPGKKWRLVEFIRSRFGGGATSKPGSRQ